MFPSEGQLMVFIIIQLRQINTIKKHLPERPHCPCKQDNPTKHEQTPRYSHSNLIPGYLVFKPTNASLRSRDLQSVFSSLAQIQSSCVCY